MTMDSAVDMYWQVLKPSFSHLYNTFVDSLIRKIDILQLVYWTSTIVLYFYLSIYCSRLSRVWLCFLLTHSLEGIGKNKRSVIYSF